MLSDAQRREAVLFGDKPQANKKANCARTSTAIRNLVTDTGSGFSADDIAVLTRAAELLDAAAARLKVDAREARAIKAEHDKRVADAISILATLPTDTIADCVAVLGTTSRIPVGRYEMERFRRPDSYWGTIHTILRDTAHDAIRRMAHDCARDKIDPAQRRQQIIDGLAAQKITHAEIINELNALAVAEQLETTK